MKFPSSLHPGTIVLLLAIAIYAIPIRWIETRNFTPLDIPVTVSDGHIRSGEFNINLGETYFVDFGGEPNSVGTRCAEDASLNTRWTVFKRGQPLVVNHGYFSQGTGTSPFVGRRFDSFDANPGIYSLVVDLLPGSECLNVAKVRLSVGTAEYDYLEDLDLLRTLCLYLAGIGIVLLVRSGSASVRERFAKQHRDHVRIFQSPGYQHHFIPRKRRPLPSMFRMPDFGYFFMVAMFPALFLYMIIRLGKTPSMGIKVRVSSPTGIYMNVQPRTKPLLVWLDAGGNYFVNEKKVPRNELGHILNHELSQRAEWTVYFEADGNAYFGDAAFAMNQIQIASGRLVWLTPKTRSEFSSLKPAQ